MVRLIICRWSDLSRGRFILYCTKEIVAEVPKKCFKMANASCVKFDDGSTDTFPANCFPVRGLIRHTEDGINDNTILFDKCRYKV